MSQIEPPEPPVLGMASRFSMRPHRAGLILAFGILGLLGGLLSFACCQGLLVFEVFGVLAVIFAREDLKDMAIGRMDPTGMGTTRAGKILAIIGFVFAGLALAQVVVLIILFAANASGL